MNNDTIKTVEIMESLIEAVKQLAPPYAARTNRAAVEWALHEIIRRSAEKENSGIS